MSRKMKVASLLTSALILTSVVTGCSGGKTGTTSQSVKGTLDGGVTNATGYPIVNSPITLKVAEWYAAGVGLSLKSDALQELEKTTGINLDITFYSDPEKANLMYASQNYPDISLRLDASDQSKNDAIESGAVVSVDKYMQYAPTWKKFLSANPDIKLQCTYTDGKIYGFPYVYLDETTYNLRDQWLINRKWLNELGLSTPKTTEDFQKYLEDVKSNAGKGSIPKNVTPLYFRYGSAIGGQFDIYGTFGVYCPGGYFIDDSGKFKCQATNTDLKAPIKYLATLYKEGLIMPQAFTDDWSAYTAALTSDPAMAGSIFAFGDANKNYATNGKWWYPMAPVQSPSGKQPYIRAQVKGSTFPRNFMIYKNNKYPVASVRLANYFADPKVSMNFNFGSQGVGWTDGSDGKYQLITNPKYTEATNAVGNFVPCLVTEDMFTDPSAKVEGTRAWAYHNIYKNYIPKTNLNIPNIPSGVLSDTDEQRRSDLDTQINNYIGTTIANWITGKADIDSGWDGYVAQLNKIGLKEYMTLNQKRLDAAAKLAAKK